MVNNSGTFKGLPQAAAVVEAVGEAMETAGFAAAFAIVAGLAGVAGLLIGRYLWPAIRRDEALALEAARLAERAAASQTRLDEQSSKLAAAEAEARAASEELARLRQREADLAEQKAQLSGEFENIANRILKATTS